jgi:hypothetical protein
MRVPFVRILRVPPLRFFHLPFFSVDSSPFLPSSNPTLPRPCYIRIIHEPSSPNSFAESREGLQNVSVVNMVKVMKVFERD